MVWTVHELVAKVALAATDPERVPSQDGRTREVPDLRTVRYYTNLGLMDRPAEFRGRTAYYGERHLLQLLAIKRLQSRGYTLAQVQEKLLGLSDRQLAELVGPIELGPTEEPRIPRPTAARAEAFWKGGGSETTTTAGSPETPLSPASPPASAPEKTTIRGLLLQEGVTLLLDAVRDLDEADSEAIRLAAEPLLQLLRKRRLVPESLTRGPR